MNFQNIIGVVDQYGRISPSYRSHSLARTRERWMLHTVMAQTVLRKGKGTTLVDRGGTLRAYWQLSRLLTLEAGIYRAGTLTETTMREIIHIQVGALPNYTGTHYWNTQESYFSYDEGNVSITDYSISFKEGRDIHNQPTLCPRLLAFDQKSNFGTLSRDPHAEEATTLQATWHGGVDRQEQERIPQSEYHSHLEDDDATEQAESIDTRIRYWSDFSRIFFDPKSIQAIPEALGMAEGDWNAGHETFMRYDDNVELMDGSVRLLVEDCHNFQGVQMINTSVFGGFSDSLLTAFRDEYPKSTILSFACLSSFTPSDITLGDSFQIKQVLNDSLSLRSLAELCDLTVPILPAPRWEKNAWFSGIRIDCESLYHYSAVISSHIETATLPLRLRSGLEDLQTFVSHLNWRKSSPFALLRGALCPQELTTDILEGVACLSFHADADGSVPFARRDVSRGLSLDDMTVYSAWSRDQEPKEPLYLCNHLPGYPVPTSFPSIFPHPRPQSLKMISSLSTTPSTATHLSGYAHFVEGAFKRRDSAILAMGLEDDDVKELANALWDVVDGYGENEEGGRDLSGGLGEDEE